MNGDGTPAAKGRPPAVLQVLPRLVTGGVERGTVEVAAALVAAGWKAVVASAGGPMVHEVERAGAIHVELPLASKNPLVMYRNAGRLAETVRRHGIDLVHARSRAPAWSAHAAAHRTDRHFVTTFHNAYGGGSWLKHRYNAIMAQGDRVIAISHYVADHARNTYGVPADKLRIVPRGVDIGRFDPERLSDERVIALARQWRIIDGAPLILLPGRLSRWKGHAVLLEAVARLKRPDVQCLIVGGGPDRYRTELVALATRLGLSGTCRIIDDCRDMAAAMRLADVVVSASTVPEGFGRVIVEAQAMGRPVIATDHGGARETIIPRETGWLVPPGDASALAAALADVLALGPGERLALGARARAHMCANFTTTQMTDRTLAVYEELIFGVPAVVAEPSEAAPEPEPEGPVAA